VAKTSGKIHIFKVGGYDYIEFDFILPTVIRSSDEFVLKLHGCRVHNLESVQASILRKFGYLD